MVGVRGEGGGARVIDYRGMWGPRPRSTSFFEALIVFNRRGISSLGSPSCRNRTARSSSAVDTNSAPQERQNLPGPPAEHQKQVRMGSACLPQATQRSPLL